MYYYYKELREKALKTRSPKDINALAEWFEQYGSHYWNGEYYDMDGYALVPIYQADGDEFIVIGYEIQ